MNNDFIQRIAQMLSQAQNITKPNYGYNSTSGQQHIGNPLQSTANPVSETSNKFQNPLGSDGGLFNFIDLVSGINPGDTRKYFWNSVRDIFSGIGGN